jgi:hypothetical protein
MKFLHIFALTLAILCTMVASFSIPYGDLDDFQVAKIFAADIDAKTTTSTTQGSIICPKPNTTWYVGENVSVVFKQDLPDQTVSIFFFDQTITLAGGPISRGTFNFIVPAAALSPPGGTSLLLAVRRQNSYLQAVDSVVVRVLPPMV